MTELTNISDPLASPEKKEKQSKSTRKAKEPKVE